MIIRDSHAYELTQDRPEQRERNPHGPHFGTKLHAVDTRMHHLTGLGALNAKLQAETERVVAISASNSTHSKISE